MKGKIRRGRRVFIFLGLAILIVVLAGIWMLAKGDDTYALSVTYRKTITAKGHGRLEIGITNIGSGTVAASHNGYLEFAGGTKRTAVGQNLPRNRLEPGEGHVIQVLVPEPQMAALEEGWRYTCLYARDNLRSRIYQWQWSDGGPGAKVNWLIPQRLKGMVLDVKGTSEWVGGNWE